MKRKLVSLVLFMAGLLVIGVPTALADGSYEIDKYQVDIDLQEDGSGNFQEKITYNFDGDFNGVFYNFDLSGIKEVTNVEVSVIDSNNKESAPFAQNNSEKTGSYQLTRSGNFMKYKVFQKATDEKKTVVYRYTIPEVVTNYADTAEFNGRIIGAGWEDPLNNVEITINLPKKAANLKAWAHGNLSGKIALENNQTVKLSMAQNPSNTFIEAHLVFPTQVTPDNPNVKNEKKLADILKQEKELAEAANRRRQLVMWIVVGMAVLAVIIAVFGSYYGRKLAGKQRFKDLFVPEHLYEIPEDMTPAVMYSATKNTLPRTTDITATLMDLVRKKQLTIEEVELNKKADSKQKSKKKKKTTYLISKVPNPKLIKLLDHEKYLIEWLLDIVGDGESVTLKEIEDYGKNSQTKAKKFTEANKKWQDKVKREADKKGYISDTNSKAVAFVVVYSIVLFILLVATVIMMLVLNGMYPAVTIIMLLVTVINAIQWIGFFPVRTLAGTTAVKQWAAFEAMLRDVSNLRMADVGSLILWDHILVYAISLGVSKEVIEALSLQFPQTELENMYIGHYYLYGWGFGSNLNQSMNNSFESSFKNAMGNAISNSSSADGSGGGFSGGSSGGFGGGSGGGAF